MKNARPGSQGFLTPSCSNWRTRNWTSPIDGAGSISDRLTASAPNRVRNIRPATSAPVIDMTANGQIIGSSRPITILDSTSGISHTNPTGINFATTLIRSIGAKNIQKWPDRRAPHFFQQFMKMVLTEHPTRGTTAHDHRTDRLVKVREVIKKLEADGWRHVSTRGSHRQFKHPSKPGRVTVPGKPSDDLAPGTLKSIWTQSGIRED